MLRVIYRKITIALYYTVFFFSFLQIFERFHKIIRNFIHIMSNKNQASLI